MDPSLQPFVFGDPDLDRLRSFMSFKAGWRVDKVDQVLIPVIKEMRKRAQEGTQTRIEHFFSPSGKGSRHSVGMASKRVQNVVSDWRSPSKQ